MIEIPIYLATWTNFIFHLWGLIAIWCFVWKMIIEGVQVQSWSVCLD